MKKPYKIIPIIALGALLMTGCGEEKTDRVIDRVIYGNIITMDEANPNAEAVAIKGKKIVAVGSKEDVSKYVNKDTKITSYDNSYVYPGFVDGHSHSALMTTLKCGGFTIPLKDDKEGTSPGDYESYAKFVKRYMDKNPGKKIYVGMGWWKVGASPTAADLDKVCGTEVPIFLVDGGGHSAWLNSKAMDELIGTEKADRDAFLAEFGTDSVIVDDKGNFTGYFVETSRFALNDRIAHPKNEIKDYVLGLEKTYLAQGFTSILDCSIVENNLNEQVSAFRELANEGKLKMKYRAYYEITEYCTDAQRDAEIQKAINLHNEFKDNEHFQIIGIKCFMDGVAEALTSWTFDPYPASAGKGDNYHGIGRWEGKEDKLLKVVRSANNNGMSVQLHAFGDKAMDLALKTFETVQKELKDAGKNTDCRNGIAHCCQVPASYIERFKNSNTHAILAPQWSTVKYGTWENEVMSFSEAGADDIYKVKSFIDGGVEVSFHTDGMTPGGAPSIIYTALTRQECEHPNLSSMVDKPHVRGENEKVDGMTALKCLTVNPAKLGMSEDSLGTIKAGMSADFTIYNTDFTNNNYASSIDNYNNAKVIAQFIDGELAYSMY